MTDNWIKDILDIEAAIEDKIANLGLKQLKQAIIGDAAIRSVLHEKPCLRVVYTSKACWWPKEQQDFVQGKIRKYGAGQ